MNQVNQNEDYQSPRLLRYRSHYRIYLIFLAIVSFLIIMFWGFKLSQHSLRLLYAQYPVEIIISSTYLGVFTLALAFWINSRWNQSVRVFPDHLRLQKGKSVKMIFFSDVESVTVVCWSLFYLKTKDGHKHYFNSSLERVDYIWEGIFKWRPDLLSQDDYDKFRINLIQYDHHQKRKEWFFRHKFVDILNWFFLPSSFLGISFLIQSQDVEINQIGLYFFRLFMYALLVLLFTSFFYSMIVKKWVFDKKIEVQLSSEPTDKLRRLDFEGLVVQRSKIFQMITACFVLALIIKTDLNLFSITKVKTGYAPFNLDAGKTLLVDNRYNCIDCRFSLNDGDLVVFGRGLIGQILAKEGELVGEVAQDKIGRHIASQNVQEVPKGHLALKASNGKDILFVRIDDLIGKIQK